jgi:hypothetical protein
LHRFVFEVPPPAKCKYIGQKDFQKPELDHCYLIDTRDIPVLW